MAHAHAGGGHHAFDAGDQQREHDDRSQPPAPSGSAGRYVALQTTLCAYGGHPNCPISRLSAASTRSITRCRRDAPSSPSLGIVALDPTVTVAAVVPHDPRVEQILAAT
jgi:hypothetical protein